MFPPFDPESDDRKPRGRMFARGQIPTRMLIPNIFTLLGLCAGLTAIRMAIEHRWDLAVAALVFAAFLDGIDGRIARLLKAQSRFGAELDSLADFVNFGVAPAIIIFNWALDDLKSMGWIVVLIYAVCAALRLARFNVALERTDQPAWQKSYFVGVPAPAGAIILLLPIYAQDLGLHLPALTPLILLYTLAIALLMVSRVPTFSGKMIGQKIPREHVPPLFVLAALFIGSPAHLSVAHACRGLGHLSRVDSGQRLPLLPEGAADGAGREGAERQGRGRSSLPIEPPSFPR